MTVAGEANVVKMSAYKKMAAMTSALLTRMSWLSRAGLTHDGARDLYTVFGYQRDLRPTDLYMKYRRQDIARPIVEAPCDALWTRPPVVNSDGEFNAAWEQLLKDHQIWSVINRLDYMTGYGRFAILVVGLDDGRKLSEPVRGGRHKIAYLQPYSEVGVKILSYEDNPSSPRFNLPVMYQVQVQETEVGMAGRQTGPARMSFEVHWSRVVHVADGIVEDTVYGLPRLEPVYNLLTDLLKVAGSTAENYWLTANRGMQVDVDKEMDLTAEDADDLAGEIDEYYHNLRRFIKTRGVKITELGAKVSDPSMTINNILALISATTRMPQRILVGSEAGQLASEQDRANWAERVNERRQKYGEPGVLVPLITAFARIGVLPVPSFLQFLWPDAFILAPLEKAQTSAQKARSAANLLKVLVDKPDFLSIKEARNIVGLGDDVPVLEDAPIETTGVSK
jgi:hypothetical protein